MQRTCLTSNADLYGPKNKEKAPRYQEQCCVTIDPNWRQAPLARIRTPRESTKRRAQGCMDLRVILPRTVLEGLRDLVNTLAVAQRTAGWPAEQAKYPRSLNYYVTEALCDFLVKHGYGEFCVEEQKPRPGRVRRFVVPTP